VTAAFDMWICDWAQSAIPLKTGATPDLFRSWDGQLHYTRSRQRPPSNSVNRCKHSRLGLRSEGIHAVGLFARVIAAPSAQNLIDFYADCGLTFSGMIPHRPDDALAVGIIYRDISEQASHSDRDAGSPVVRNFEAALKTCYTAQLQKSRTLQPNFQYIVHRGGDVLNANGTDAGNAIGFGIRSTLKF
jgi:carbohydrate-selective porin OprB